MTMWRTLPFACLAVVAVTGVNALGAGPSELQLGKNLAGETCRTSGDASLARTTDILCGDGTTTSGSLRVVAMAVQPPAGEAGRDVIQRTALAARSTDAGQVTCDGGQSVSPSDPSAPSLMICSLQSNGWPRVILAAAKGGLLYEAEGLPSALPALQSAIAQASGRATNDAEASSALQIAQAKLPAGVLKTASSDASSYEQYVQLGRLYGSANNYAGAENAYRHALDIEVRLFGDRSTPVGETVLELALQVSNQSRFDEAAALFQRATPIIEAAAAPDLQARLASYRALDAANQRQFADALRFARDATALHRQELDTAPKDEDTGEALASKGELAHSLRIEAEMALRLDDVAGARAAAEESLWIITSEPGLPLWWRPAVLGLMGRINEKQGRVVPAEADYRDAVDLDKNVFGATAPTALAELELGKFYVGQQVYGPALTAYRDAFSILQKDPVARAQIVPDQIVPYIVAAAAGNASHELDAEVFTASQYFSTGVADQTIARMAAREAAGNQQLADLIRQSQDATRTRDNLRVDLAAEYAKPDDERDPSREKKASADLQLASARSDQLAGQVNKSFPDYARLADPGPAALSDMQSKMNGDEAFISYVIGVNGAYGILVTPHGVDARQLSVTQDGLAADIADLRKAFVPASGRVQPFNAKLAFSLYKQLLGPFEGQLAGVRHLVVASSGDLAALPFAVLVSKDPDGAAYTDAAWLIRSMSLSQVPSARAFLALRAAEQSHTAAKEPFLGIGAPTFTGGSKLDAFASTCIDNGAVPADVLRSLPPLPETAGEVTAVGHKLGSNAVLLGASASEADLRTHRLENYNVLYFATHGLLPGELHCQSEPGLALSPPAHATSTDEDGLLTAGEIASLKLNADLVVLSACNTAAGGNGRFGGSALEGLADAFFDAGARAVIASHWQVPSTATVKLMTGMFDRLGANRGAGLADALRQSQLALISEPATSHPFNWAAFTLIGDGDASLNTVALPGAKLADARKP